MVATLAGRSANKGAAMTGLRGSGVAAMRAVYAIVVVLAGLCALAHAPARGDTPEWCRSLPRPEYKKLERVTTKDTWFEVYRVVPGVLAIYEPHQAEETIGYLMRLVDSQIGREHV